MESIHITITITDEATSEMVQGALNWIAQYVAEFGSERLSGAKVTIGDTGHETEEYGTGHWIMDHNGGEERYYHAPNHVAAYAGYISQAVILEDQQAVQAAWDNLSAAIGDLVAHGLTTSQVLEEVVDMLQQHERANSGHTW
jgi:hypothetical protein